MPQAPGPDPSHPEPPLEPTLCLQTRAPGAQDETLALTLPPMAGAVLHSVAERLRDFHWDRYEVLYALGCGGMGCVFLARDRRLDRRVAIKFLYGQTADASDRYLEEARTQARIEHPRVCRVYEAGEIRGLPYIVMQLVEGRPMDEAMRSLPLEQRVHLLRMTTEAVHAAHHQGLVHRDLKPGNILVAPDEDGVLRPVVLDFGLARDQASLEESLHGIAQGTPAYMSPEQARGDVAHLDRRTDIFSLGVLAYQVLTERLPFDGFRDLGDLLDRHRLGALDPRIHRPDLPADLAHILDKCLQWDPARRYDSMRALGEDLRRFLEGEPIQARKTGAGERLRRWIWRNRALAAGYGLALLFGLAAVAALAIGGARARTQTHHALRFSQAVEDLELTLASLRTAPQPQPQALASLEARLVVLEREVEGASRLAQGPGHAALGRARLALDDPDQAARHYERALATGYSTPEVRLGLSAALTAQFQDHLGTIYSFNPAVHKHLLAEARRSLAEVSLRQLREARVPLDTPFVQARKLLDSDRPLEALALLRKALEGAPWRLDLRRPIAELLLTCYLSGQDAPSTPGRTADFDTTLAFLQESRPWAQSDPFFWVKEAQLRMARLNRGSLARFPEDPETERVMACVEQARKRWPDYPPALETAASVHLLKALIRSNRNQADGASLQEAERACETLLARDPRRPMAHALLVRIQDIRLRAGLIHLDPSQPQPLVETVLHHYRAARRERPILRGVLSNDVAAFLYATAATLEATGGNPRPFVDEGLRFLEDALVQLPDYVAPHATRASLLAIRSFSEDDPVGTLQESSRELATCMRLEPDVSAYVVNQSHRALERATWRLEADGLDPEPDLTEARRLLRRAQAMDSQAAPDPEATTLMQGLALRFRLQTGRAGATDIPPFQRTLRAGGGIPACGPPCRLWLDLTHRSLLEGRDPALALREAEAALPSGVPPGDVSGILLEAELLLLKARAGAGDPQARLAEAKARLDMAIQRGNPSQCLRALGLHLRVLWIQDRQGAPSALAAARPWLLRMEERWPRAAQTRLAQHGQRLLESRRAGQPAPEGAVRGLEALQGPDQGLGSEARALLEGRWR